MFLHILIKIRHLNERIKYSIQLSLKELPERIRNQAFIATLNRSLKTVLLSRVNVHLVEGVDSHFMVPSGRANCSTNRSRCIVWSGLDWPIAVKTYQWAMMCWDIFAYLKENVTEIHFSPMCLLLRVEKSRALYSKKAASCSCDHWLPSWVQPIGRRLGARNIYSLSFPVGQLYFCILSKGHKFCQVAIHSIYILDSINHSFQSSLLP